MLNKFFGYSIFINYNSELQFIYNHNKYIHTDLLNNIINIYVKKINKWNQKYYFFLYFLLFIETMKDVLLKVKLTKITFYIITIRKTKMKYIHLHQILWYGIINTIGKPWEKYVWIAKREHSLRNIHKEDKT